MSTTVITDAGLSAAASAGQSGPQIKVAYAKLGSSLITPVSTMTNVSGFVYTVLGSNITYQKVSDSTVAFNIYIDDTVGDFSVGNFGLFLEDNTMFTITGLVALDPKRATTVSQIGNGKRYTVIVNLSGVANISNLTLLVPDEAALPEVATDANLPTASVAPFPVYLVRSHSSFNNRPVLACRYNGSWWWCPTVDSSGDSNGLILPSSMFDTGIVAGNCVYLDTTSVPIFKLADSNVQTKKPVGVRGAGNVLYIHSQIYTDANTPYTVGTKYYCGTGGTIGQLQSTETSAYVGIAISSKKIFLQGLNDNNIFYNSISVVGSTVAELNLRNINNSTNEKIWTLRNTADLFEIVTKDDAHSVIQSAYQIDRNGTTITNQKFNINNINILYIDGNGISATAMYSPVYNFTGNNSNLTANSSYFTLNLDTNDALYFDKTTNNLGFNVNNTNVFVVSPPAGPNSGKFSLYGNRNFYADPLRGYFWEGVNSSLVATSTAFTIQMDSGDLLDYDKTNNKLNITIGNAAIYQFDNTRFYCYQRDIVIDPVVGYNGYKFSNDMGLFSLPSTATYETFFLGSPSHAAGLRYSSDNSTTLVKMEFFGLTSTSLMAVKHNYNTNIKTVTINGDLNMGTGNNGAYPIISVNQYLYMTCSTNIVNNEVSSIYNFGDNAYLSYDLNASEFRFYVPDPTLTSYSYSTINRSRITHRIKTDINLTDETDITRRSGNFTSGDYSPNAAQFNIISKSVNDSVVIGFYNNVNPSLTYATRIGLDSIGLFRIAGGSFVYNAFTINGSGNATIAGTLTQASDIRVKENITSLNNTSIDLISCLNAVKYNKKNQKTVEYGFIAQELEKVLPNLVTEDTEGLKGINYIGLIALLVDSVNELNAKIIDLRGKI